MNSRTLDCIVVGPKEPDLQAAMSEKESMKDVSGAYRFWKSKILYEGNKWITHMDLLNKILSQATQKAYDLHIANLPHLGVFYLKSFLARKAFDIEIVNSFNQDKKRLAALLQTGPRAVAITTTFYYDLAPVADIIHFIRRYNSETRIIVGGPCIFNICNTQSKGNQEYLFSQTGADIYIQDSQGEQTLANVLKELRNEKRPDLSRISNLIYFERPYPAVDPQKEPSCIRTSRQIEKNSLDDNVIDWSLFPKTSYTPTTLMRTSRGCPFTCAFCSYPVLGGVFKPMSLDVLEGEMRQLYDAGVKNIIFVDDTFNIPRSRFKKILKIMIANQFNFDWVSFFRCSEADEETFDLMKASGCMGVFLGIESGDPQMLRHMNKKSTIEQYQYGLRELNKRHIVSRAFFIVGFPGETEQSIQNTLAFIEESRPTNYILSLFFYDHCTPIHRKAQQFGLTGQGFRWGHNTMDWREACDHIETMLKKIKNSKISSSGWLSAYLNGLGVPPHQIERFYELTQPILLKNFNSAIPTDGDIDKTTFEQLLSLGREMARYLELPGV